MRECNNTLALEPDAHAPFNARAPLAMQIAKIMQSFRVLLSTCVCCARINAQMRAHTQAEVAIHIAPSL